MKRLERRVFKKKNIRAFNRRWYEYLWPRDASIMLAKPRILSPTLIRSPRFVLDDVGYLSDHACLMIQPTKKTDRTWREFQKAMANALRGKMPDDDLLLYCLRYCLAFLNSKYAQERLTVGHRPTPKGSYAITEEYLKEIPIPAPTKKSTARAIIDLVGKLGDPGQALQGTQGRDDLEETLAGKVQEALNPIEA